MWPDQKYTSLKKRKKKETSKLTPNNSLLKTLAKPKETILFSFESGFLLFYILLTCIESDVVK